MINNIDVRNSKWSVSTLLKKYNSKQLNLVGDILLNSETIEKILLNIPLQKQVVDARNELEFRCLSPELITIIHYMNDDFKLLSSGLLFLQSEIGDCKFSQLERKYQRRIEDYYLDLIMIHKETPSNVFLIL